jgi:hypothetical protein
MMPKNTPFLHAHGPDTESERPLMRQLEDDPEVLRMVPGCSHFMRKQAAI